MASKAASPAQSVSRPDQIETSQTPRTLELYCMRSGWSAHSKLAGNDAYYLDWNKEAVKPSWEPHPDYTTEKDGTRPGLSTLRRIEPHSQDGRLPKHIRTCHPHMAVFCLNGLDDTKFIHLDFLDFAVAVLRCHINVGALHAIHDGLDCSRAGAPKMSMPTGLQPHGGTRQVSVGRAAAGAPPTGPTSI